MFKWNVFLRLLVSFVHDNFLVTWRSKYGFGLDFIEDLRFCTSCGRWFYNSCTVSSHNFPRTYNLLLEHLCTSHCSFYDIF